MRRPSEATSPLIRQFHRWLSICFTVGVVANTVVIASLAGKPPPSWIYLLALIPLFLLLFSGLYLFVRPYAAGWGRRVRVAGAQP
jgi:hypothetical protein